MQRLFVGSLLVSSGMAMLCVDSETTDVQVESAENTYTPPEGWKCAHSQSIIERSSAVLVKCDKNGNPVGPHDGGSSAETPGTGDGGDPGHPTPPEEGGDSGNPTPPGEGGDSGNPTPPQGGGTGTIPPDTHPFPHLIAFQKNWGVSQPDFEPGTPMCEKLKLWDLTILAFYVNYDYVEGGPMDCKSEMKPLENAWLLDAIETCTGRRPGVAIFGWNNRNCIKDISSDKLNEQVIAMYREHRPRVLHVDYLTHAELPAAKDMVKEQNQKIISLIKTLKEAEPNAQVMLSANSYYMNHPDYMGEEGLDMSYVIDDVKDLLHTLDPLYYGAATKDINSPQDLAKHKEQTDMYHEKLGQRCCVGVEGVKIQGTVADFAKAATENQVPCFTYWATDTQDTAHGGDDWAKVMREIYVGAGIKSPEPNTAPSGEGGSESQTDSVSESPGLCR